MENKERGPFAGPLPPAASQAELDLIQTRKLARAHLSAEEQRSIEKGRALWPDIRAKAENKQPDLSHITREIARGR